MCGPLKEPSRLLLTQLSARLDVLEVQLLHEQVSTLLQVSLQKVRGSLDALVEQLQFEGLLPAAAVFGPLNPKEKSNVEDQTDSRTAAHERGLARPARKTQYRSR